MNPTECLEVNPERATGDVIDGEAIIINLATGAYYSMQGVGGEIWAMLNERRSAGAIAEQIAASYDVSPDVAQRDVEAVVDQLLDEGLIRFCAAAAEPFPARASASRQPYAPPQLQVYRDMEDLLALDPPAPGMNRIAWSGDTPK